MQNPKTIVLFNYACHLPDSPGIFGYEKSDKGRTSGSRVIFKNGDGRPIMLHKPHPGNIVKRYAMKQILDNLIESGLLK